MVLYSRKSRSFCFHPVSPKISDPTSCPSVPHLGSSQNVIVPSSDWQRQWFEPLDFSDTMGPHITDEMDSAPAISDCWPLQRSSYGKWTRQSGNISILIPMWKFSVAKSLLRRP